MASKAGAPESFSAIVHRLYGACYEMPVEAFQPEVLRLIEAVVPFESSMWGTGSMAGDGRVAVHAIALHNQPPEMIVKWAEFSDQDRSVDVVTARPGYVMSAQTRTLHAAPECRGMRDFNREYGIETSLIVCGQDPGGLYSWLSLFRSDPDWQYREEERLFFESLWPHIVQALAINRQLSLDRMFPARPGGASARAIVDRRGFVHRSDAGFAALLRKEWPYWDGRRLPRELIALLASRSQRTYRGPGVVMQMQQAADLFFLSARAPQPADELTPREREVARLFASGQSHREIASELGVSPETVRSQIQQVYRKLDVGDKGALATLLARCD